MAGLTSTAMPPADTDFPPINLQRVVVMIITAATTWVFTEWLFFATKASFLSLYSVAEKLDLLATTAFLMSVALLVASIPFITAGWFIDRSTKYRAIAPVVVLFPTAVLLAMVSLLLIDNFTLTMFGWGVRDSQDVGVWVYRILVTILIYSLVRSLQRVLSGPGTGVAILVITPFAVLIAAIGVPFVSAAILMSPAESDDVVAPDRELPNILLLSSDGLSVAHMSMYGYQRPTTPFLESVKGEFLIATNNFSNAADTGGSVVSLLTSKLPTTTRVIYPPDVLRGSDSFQHLPGMLKKLGYYNGDISMRHYADPYDLNMRNGFAEANFRKLGVTGSGPAALLRSFRGLNPAMLFTNRITERLSTRFDRIAMDIPIQDPLAEVNKPERRFVRDDARMAEINRFLNESQQPFFLHVHMMGTHGSRFKPRQRIWSTEESYPVKWVEDGYDDAILDFDHYVEETYGLLKDRGLLERTVFIISSDHGFRHDPLSRVPLMVRFPGLSRTGHIQSNTQNIDIAPTILEAIGIAPPAWMEGRSLLSRDVDKLGAHPIFAVESVHAKSAVGINWSVSNPQPPWYSLGRLFMARCNQGFVMRTDNMVLREKEIEGSTLGCKDKISLHDARLLMMAHLRGKGYLPSARDGQ